MLSPIFFFQAEDGIRDFHVTGVQTCALPIYPADAKRAHEPGDPVAAHPGALAGQLPPELLGAIHLEVLIPDPADLDLELGVTDRAGRRRPLLVGVVGGRCDLQHLADRLDTELLPVGVDEPGHFGRRGSSSLAKKAEAALRIWLARRSSRTSRSSSAIRCRSAVGTPRRRP